MSENTSCLEQLEVSAMASIPSEVRAMTWSFIKDINGETTTVKPSTIRAVI